MGFIPPTSYLTVPTNKPVTSCLALSSSTTSMTSFIISIHPFAATICRACEAPGSIARRSGPHGLSTLCDGCGLHYRKLVENWISQGIEVNPSGEAGVAMRCISCEDPDHSPQRWGPSGPCTLCDTCGRHYAKISSRQAMRDIRGIKPRNASIFY